MIRTEIQIPRLERSSLVSCYAQQRPFREGGNRLEREDVKGKVVIHNYGHGGAGISLAPGCAVVAVSLASEYLIKYNPSSVAVLGSGIVGLFNCHQLLKRHPSLKITVYAQRIPVFGQKDNDKMITSQVAPGFWLPYGYGQTNKTLHQKLSAWSLREFFQLSKRPQYSKTLREVMMYDISDEQFKNEYYSELTAELKPTFKEIKVRLDGKTEVMCRVFKTMKIDLQPFLEAFIQDLKAKGVAFVAKKIDEKSLSELPETLIFNSIGLGAREVFGDTKMKGIKGHLIEFRNPNPEKYDFLMKANIGKQVVTYYMHDSRIILGLTREAVEDCRVEQEKMNTLLASHEKVLQKYGLSPTLPKL